jgi:hypothetical protein
MKYSPYTISALFLFANFAFACPSQEVSEKNAAKVIYSDEDVKRYICTDGAANCDFEEFFSKLNISTIDLNSVGKSSEYYKKDGLLIEPLHPFKQYFSAVFLRQSCTFELVFSPDVTQSGLSFLRKNKLKMPTILSRTQESAYRWNLTEYAYNSSKKSYIETKTECLKITKDSKSVAIKCN